MPIFGSAAYVPGGQFNFPRSYVYRVTFGFGAGAIITPSGGNFYITDGTNPIVHVVCNFRPNAWAWSSNVYSLDYLIEDWWLIIDPNPNPLPLNFALYYQVWTADNIPELAINIAGATTRYENAMPDAPPGYWKPPPPP